MLNAEPPVFEDFNVNEINTSEQSEINKIYPSVITRDETSSANK